jgi:hypothetical protein
MEEINKLKTQSKINEDFIINEKNSELSKIKIAYEDIIKEEKYKLIFEYENKLQMMIINHQQYINCLSSKQIGSNDDLNSFKDVLIKQVKNHYETEFYKLKDVHSTDINEIRNEKMRSIEMLKKENEVLINNLKEIHRKEIEAIIGIKEENSYIKDENDFKERILIDYLKEKFVNIYLYLFKLLFIYLFYIYLHMLFIFMTLNYF